MDLNALIIDDDKRNIFALKTALKSRGILSYGVCCAKEGLLLLRAPHTFNVVLLDMMMPELDGYEFLKALRNDNHFDHPPIIAVTARAMIGDRQNCIEAGADGYVAKPVNIDILIKEINSVI